MAEPIQLEHHLTIDGTAYDALWLEAREALDEIGILRCEISDHAGGPDPAALVGKTLVLTVTRRGGGDEKKIAAYVVEAEAATTRGDEETGTVVTARPRMFRLTQRADCRVFQDMTAVDIVKKVLSGAGVPDDAQKWQ